MSHRFIVVGDSHSHGGQVTAGAPHSTTHGKPVVRLGDPAICKVHGSTHVTAVSGKMMFDGKEAACADDSLACGARLIATQMPTGKPKVDSDYRNPLSGTRCAESPGLPHRQLRSMQFALRSRC